jgi:hypothetical protein
MTAREVEKVFYTQPFRPFRLRLVDGGEVTVRKPRRASVSGDQVALVGISRTSPKGLGKEGLRLLRLDQITAAEPVEESWPG